MKWFLEPRDDPGGKAYLKVFLISLAVFSASFGGCSTDFLQHKTPMPSGFIDGLFHLAMVIVLDEETKRGELKGFAEGKKTFDFIINQDKNLFFNPKGQEKGSPINFLSEFHGVGLRIAAQTLKNIFLQESKEPKRPIPELELKYTKEVNALGLTEEICRQYEIGMPQGRSIMAGKIAFKLYDQSGSFAGYIGKEVKKDGWFYPKGFRRFFLYNGNRCNSDYCILVPDVLDCVLLFQIGFPYCVSSLGLSPTDDQMEALKRYRRILLIHSAPGNTLARLSKQAFVKVSEIQITAKTTAEEIKQLF